MLGGGERRHMWCELCTSLCATRTTCSGTQTSDTGIAYIGHLREISKLFFHSFTSYPGSTRKAQEKGKVTHNHVYGKLLCMEPCVWNF